MRITNWSRNEDLWNELRVSTRGSGDLICSWYNDTADELVALVSEEQDYATKWYTNVTEGFTTERNLIHDTSKSSLKSRTTTQLQEHPDGINYQIFKRSALETPATLEDWAYIYGAATYMTEKIGSRKESGGTVAWFEGSTRYGDGAYIAFASEDGPRGVSYVSIGSEMNGYYTVDSKNVNYNNRGPIELADYDDISFSADGEIHIEKEGTYEKQVLVIQPTDKGREVKAWKNR